MKLLAIETSCDETAAAVISATGKVLSSVVASQIKDHQAFGGVVPEIASRRHVELIQPVVFKALRSAHLGMQDLGGVAVTQGPGLVGALLVGISFAKALAYGLKVPLFGVNHLEGHLCAAEIEHEVCYPHIGLVVSGGHTSLYRVEAPSDMTLIGQTLDDAAGEAFDKVAKLLNLGYPGGVIIDRIAAGVDHHDLKLPRPLLGDGTYDFSFSGLKTAVLNLVVREGIFPGLNLRFSGLPGERHPAPGKEGRIPVIAAAFQAAVVEVLVSKALAAVEDHGLSTLVISGGVACNSALRASLEEAASVRGIRLVIPHPRYCTDNAAMIGVAGLRLARRGQSAPLDMNAFSRWQT